MKVWFGTISLLFLSAQAVAQEWSGDSPQVLLARKANSDSSLPSNSEIWLSLDQGLTSHNASVGTPFSLRVSRDVMVGNYVVIPRGTPAHGKITYRTGKGAFGKSAKMEFDLTDVQIGDRTVPVSGHYRIAGEGNTGATVGAIAVVGVVGAAFVTGHSATAAQGSEWRAYTSEPLKFSVPLQTASNDEPSPPPVVQRELNKQTAQSQGRRLPHEDVIEVIL